MESIDKENVYSMSPVLYRDNKQRKIKMDERFPFSLKQEQEIRSRIGDGNKLSDKNEIWLDTTSICKIDNEDDEIFFGQVTDKEQRKASKFSRRKTALFKPGFRKDLKLMRYTMDPTELCPVIEETAHENILKSEISEQNSKDSSKMIEKDKSLCEERKENINDKVMNGTNLQLNVAEENENQKEFAKDDNDKNREKIYPKHEVQHQDTKYVKENVEKVTEAKTLSKFFQSQNEYLGIGSIGEYVKGEYTNLQNGTLNRQNQEDSCQKTKKTLHNSVNSVEAHLQNDTSEISESQHNNQPGLKVVKPSKLHRESCGAFSLYNATPKSMLAMQHKQLSSSVPHLAYSDTENEESQLTGSSGGLKVVKPSKLHRDSCGAFSIYNATPTSMLASQQKQLSTSVPHLAYRSAGSEERKLTDSSGGNARPRTVRCLSFEDVSTVTVKSKPIASSGSSERLTPNSSNNKSGLSPAIRCLSFDDVTKAEPEPQPLQKIFKPISFSLGDVRVIESVIAKNNRFTPISPSKNNSSVASDGDDSKLEEMSFGSDVSSIDNSLAEITSNRFGPGSRRSIEKEDYALSPLRKAKSTPNIASHGFSLKRRCSTTPSKQIFSVTDSPNVVFKEPNFSPSLSVGKMQVARPKVLRGSYKRTKYTHNSEPIVECASGSKKTDKIPETTVNLRAVYTEKDTKTVESLTGDTKEANGSTKDTQKGNGLTGGSVVKITGSTPTWNKRGSCQMVDIVEIRRKSVLSQSFDMSSWESPEAFEEIAEEANKVCDEITQQKEQDEEEEFLNAEKACSFSQDHSDDSANEKTPDKSKNKEDPNLSVTSVNSPTMEQILEEKRLQLEQLREAKKKLQEKLAEKNAKKNLSKFKHSPALSHTKARIQPSTPMNHVKPLKPSSVSRLGKPVSTPVKKFMQSTVPKSASPMVRSRGCSSLHNSASKVRGVSKGSPTVQLRAPWQYSTKVSTVLTVSPKENRFKILESAKQGAAALKSSPLAATLSLSTTRSPKPSMKPLPQVRYKEGATPDQKNRKLDAVTHLHTLCNSQQQSKIISKARTPKVVKHVPAHKEAEKVKWDESLVVEPAKLHKPTSESTPIKPILSRKSIDKIYPFHSEPASPVVVTKSKGTNKLSMKTVM